MGLVVTTVTWVKIAAAMILPRNNSPNINPDICSEIEEGPR